jgi:hypothetical protein
LQDLAREFSLPGNGVTTLFFGACSTVNTMGESVGQIITERPQQSNILAPRMQFAESANVQVGPVNCAPLRTVLTSVTSQPSFIV